ncbi:MAG: M64 family metallopeptidase [Bacteroides sp.]
MKNRIFQTSLFVLLTMLTAWGCSSGSEERIEPQLSVNVNALAVKSAGETVSVQVTCNVPYEVLLPAAVEWITHRAPSSGAAGAVQFHSFEVKANEQYAERTATIRFRTKEMPQLTADVVLTQMQLDAILVANKTQEAKPEGGRLQFVINTNVEFQVTCSESWIKAASSTRALEEKTLSFDVEPNEVTDSREATITITSGALKQEVKVTQKRWFRDREALKAFYQAAEGEQWSDHANWCTDQPLSSWKGVEVDGEGRVKAISLPNNSLKGDATKLLTQLAQMDHLQTISLPNNSITGELPEALGNLKDLRYFDLMYNQLSGSLPTCFSSLEQLTFINLYFNNLTGTIPEAYNELFGRHAEQLYFYVGYNYLKGDLPEKLQTHQTLANYWHFILPQYEGYGFNPCKLPAMTGVKKCIDGTTIDLKAHYAAHRYTLFYYWGSDIGTSTAFIARINALLDRYSEKGLSVVGARKESADAELQEIQTEQLVAVPHLQWSELPVNLDPPLFMLVDAEGTVRYISCTEYMGYNTIPQFHGDLDGVFDYVAQCFGDEKFEYDLYTSTDYSHDGEVLTLQKATVGKGVDLVFLGDGFTDQDMASGGRYEKVMQQAVEQFFAFEPYTSLRNRFNCYAVKAVSPNAEFVEGTVHAIDESDSQCKAYAKLAPIKNSNKPMVIVVYNDGCSGRSYTRIWSDGAFYAYNMSGANQVLNHEACGHGVANLGDEYIEPGNEQRSLPQDDKDLLDTYHDTYHWYENLDWRNDPQKVRWSRILNDERFAAEKVGIYEGAFYYGYGAYRPTENSMMRYNDCGFNAPSREIIYKRVMSLSEGSSWSYDYEQFVAFDAAYRNQATTRSLLPLKSESERQEWVRKHREPLFVDAASGHAMKEARLIVPLR